MSRVLLLATARWPPPMVIRLNRLLWSDGQGGIAGRRAVAMTITNEVNLNCCSGPR